MRKAALAIGLIALSNFAAAAAAEEIAVHCVFEKSDPSDYEITPSRIVQDGKSLRYVVKILITERNISWEEDFPAVPGYAEIEINRSTGTIMYKVTRKDVNKTTIESGHCAKVDAPANKF